MSALDRRVRRKLGLRRLSFDVSAREYARVQALRTVTSRHFQREPFANDIEAYSYFIEGLVNCEELWRKQLFRLKAHQFFAERRSSS